MLNSNSVVPKIYFEIKGVLEAKQTQIIGFKCFFFFSVQKGYFRIETGNLSILSILWMLNPNIVVTELYFAFKGVL